MSDRAFIRHVVFFSATSKADIDRIIKGLSLLKEIPHATTLEIMQNSRVDALSAEIDVVVYGEFADDAALQAYKAHPLYQKSIQIVRPLRDIRIAADF
ncbi:Dabb family protein [Actibacterium sp. 188UL27-1]|uniref:Dabb family protein n=1 Tax=Actibacterium sp. 188UL27-1 TaxID=2786961 RepID=UPI001959040A|nr:Dabb family protein [Actibacterium sp. 188UL27-1]MBM7069317.1 Dabb family protein [Actibacterium sp. 188UL27-1]